MPNVRDVNIDKIYALAEDQGIALSYLCNAIGKQRYFLTGIKRKKGYIDDRELAIIAEKLHTTPEYLTDKTDDPALPKSKATHKEKPADLSDNELDHELQEMLMKLSPAQQSQVKAFVAGMKSKFGGSKNG